MIRISFLLIAFVGGCVTMPTTKVTDTSLADIRKAPWAFHDKIVRVRGTFNECLSYSCDLCPTFEAQFLDFENHHAAGCMGVSFATDIGEHLESVDDSHRRRTEIKLQYLAEHAARFTTSTVVARYDAGCAGVQDPNDPEIIRICSDRASELEDARTEKVHIRRTGATGAITSYGVERVTEIRGADRRNLLQAFSKQIEPVGKKSTYFTYLESDEYARQGLAENEMAGGVCQCSTTECTPDDWPKQVAGTWNITPANPYYCWQAKYQKGNWRFNAEN